MVSVRFYDEVDDSLLKFAVILTKARGKWRTQGGGRGDYCNGKEGT